MSLAKKGDFEGSMQYFLNAVFLDVNLAEKILKCGYFKQFHKGEKFKNFLESL